MVDDENLPELREPPPDPPPGNPEETRAWLTEHERALDRLRAQVAELEAVVDAERDATVLHAVAAAGMFSLLIALSLPWLVQSGDDKSASGWSLLLAPLAAPLTAGAAYLVVIAVVLHAMGLIGRGRSSALVAAVVSALSGLATIGLIFTVASDPDVDAGPGPGVSLVLVIILGIVWGSITDGRRWTD
jgi:hypothetical protein